MLRAEPHPEHVAHFGEYARFVSELRQRTH